MTKHLNIYVYGLVQGVFFRASTMAAAIRLGVKGFIRNGAESNSVYIEAEGEDETLKQFVDWCYMGPVKAEVEKVVTEEGPMKNYSNFVIQR